ncbi:conserved hypothetical protein [Parafrankia sp. Ea1.12]|nr:conserved hypothetical protein [Parafrankia sp. Ea1.12]
MQEPTSEPDGTDRTRPVCGNESGGEPAVSRPADDPPGGPSLAEVEDPRQDLSSPPGTDDETGRGGYLHPSEGYPLGEDERAQPSVVPPASPGPDASDPVGGAAVGPGSGPSRRRNVLLVVAACVAALIIAVPVVVWTSSGSNGSGSNGSGSAGGNLRDADGEIVEGPKGVRPEQDTVGSASQQVGVAGSSVAPVTPEAGGEPSRQVPTSGPGGSGSKPDGSGSLAPADAPAPTVPPASQGARAPAPPAAPAPAPAPAPTSAPAPAPNPNPYSATQVCGSGYSQIDRHSLAGDTAVIYLLYNGSRNCVVTLKSGSGVGVAESMGAWVQVEGSSARQSDSGSFQYYAGPVYVYAPGKCVKWGGSYAGSSWGSGWEHCG